MSQPSRLTVLLLMLLLNAIVSAGLIHAHARWLSPSMPRFAVLDVAELYRLKEAHAAALLTRSAVSDGERVALLHGVQGFGMEVTRQIQQVTRDCRCLLLARGAVVGQDSLLPDLTPDVRQRLGL